MQNDNIKGAVHDMQRKLDAFKAKIRYQQVMAQALTVEFEALNSEFESLKQQFGASSEQIESTSEKFDALSSNFEATSFDFESTSEQTGASSEQIESTSSDFESTSEKFDASSFKSESTSSNFESTSERIDASASVQELASLIRRSVKEKKIYFGQPNIPNRLAQILLAFGEREKLSVAEMREITGASRNTLVRDIKILKLMGWLEFHGSRKNGYFTLTDSGFDVLVRKDRGGVKRNREG